MREWGQHVSLIQTKQKANIIINRESLFMHIYAEPLNFAVSIPDYTGSLFYLANVCHFTFSIPCIIIRFFNIIQQMH